VSVSPPERFRGPLLPLPDPPAFDEDVVLVGHTIDLYRAEHVPPELHHPIFARDGSLRLAASVPPSPGATASIPVSRAGEGKAADA